MYVTDCVRERDCVCVTQTERERESMCLSEPYLLLNFRYRLATELPVLGEWNDFLILLAIVVLFHPLWNYDHHKRCMISSLES